MPTTTTNAIQVRLLIVAAAITLAAATNYVRGGLDADARKSRQLNLFKEDRIIGGSRVSLEFCCNPSIDDEEDSNKDDPIYIQAETDRYPYSVSMQDGSGHFCGGSLISRDCESTRCKA